jgi:hypothetical protein
MGGCWIFGKQSLGRITARHNGQKICKKNYLSQEKGQNRIPGLLAQGSPGIVEKEVVALERLVHLERKTMSKMGEKRTSTEKSKKVPWTLWVC